jgi:hypothetical protein
MGRFGSTSRRQESQAISSFDKNSVAFSACVVVFCILVNKKLVSLDWGSACPLYHYSTWQENARGLNTPRAEFEQAIAVFRQPLPPSLSAWNSSERLQLLAALAAHTCCGRLCRLQDELCVVPWGLCDARAACCSRAVACTVGWFGTQKEKKEEIAQEVTN